MFSRILTSAVFAGAVAGVLAALLQLLFVQPVLLHAELYESGQLVHFGAGEVASAQPVEAGFEPLRDGLSILFTMLTYTGYAFLLIAGMALAEARGVVVDGRRGILWGLAGYVAFHLAPAVSLPPEVPGVAAADVEARQIWWFATVAASGLAVWLIAFGRNLTMWVAAVALLLAPHVVGAPHPAAFAGTVPPEIAALFASRALGVGLAAWVLLGVFAGHFWQREDAAALAARQA